jgi:lipid II:glycine glycyltransferase (peptidoglycan interpeptide bridge formation enzyme)
LHIEPYYELIQRDREGQPVVGGFNRQKAIKNLQNLGFVSVKSDNPKYLFILDLKGAKEDQLFASFKQNTRNLISRTARKGVTVRELGREELVKFKQITESTSERRHFSDKPLSYYETMYDLFAKKGEVKFIVAEVAGTKSDATSPAGHKDLARAARSVPEGHAASDLVSIAAAMFITYGDEVIYLFSGSDEKYMKEYNAQYAIQWYMIKYALKNHFKKYNFYGIQGLPDSDKPGYGIYKFKKGFTTPENGRVIEQIGAYELPVNSFFYGLHKILSKIKHAK